MCHSSHKNYEPRSQSHLNAGISSGNNSGSGGNGTVTLPRDRVLRLAGMSRNLWIIVTTMPR